MAQIREKNLTEKSNASMADFLRLVGEDGGSYRTLVSDIAKAVVESYGDSALYGSTQTIREAFSKVRSDMRSISILDKTYPVGSIYMSVNSVSPGELFGGKWEQIKDKFLLASGNHTNGTTGGAETVSLTTANLPSHTHSFTTGGGGEHRHNLVGSKYGSNYCASGSRSGVGANADANTTLYTNTVPNHTHSGITNPTGSGTAHNNMPPYLTVNVWKRTE